MSTSSMDTSSLTEEKREFKEGASRQWKASPPIAGLRVIYPGAHRYFMLVPGVDPQDLNRPVAVAAVDNSEGLISGSYTDTDQAYLVDRVQGEIGDVILLDISFGSLGQTWGSTIARQKRGTPESLTEHQVNEDLYRSTRGLFMSALDEEFEDGLESEFLLRLKDIVLDRRQEAIQAISTIVTSNFQRPEVIAETLQLLGDIDDPSTYRERLTLLENSLSNASRWIRDGAALGIASMNDPHAIAPLQTAAANEEIKDLKDDLMKVLKKLENNSGANVSTQDQKA